MLWSLVTNLAKPLALGCGLAWFCFSASWQVMLRHCKPLSHSSSFLCWDTPHPQGLDAWSAGKGSGSQPSAALWLLHVLPDSCQSASSTLCASKCTSRHKASCFSLTNSLDTDLFLLLSPFPTASSSFLLKDAMGTRAHLQFSPHEPTRVFSPEDKEIQ